MWAKQSTAATLIVGPILDSTGAEYTSAVIGDLSLSKNGGTLTALASAASLTHIANGQYTLVLTTGNTDTLGRAQITCNKATYQMPEMRLMVVPAMVFDSLVLGTDDLDTNVTKWNNLATVALPLVPTVAGRTLDVSSGGEAGIDWANIGSQTTTVAFTGTTIATTQKVDVETIKTRALTAAAGITFGVYVGGTAAAAVASTALSTAQWTNTLATNIGTTNTTVANNLDATVSSRLASASYAAPPSASTISTQVASDLATAHGAGSWLTATGFSTPANVTAASDAILTDLAEGVVLNSATQGQIDNVLDGVGWLLADATGAIAAPQSATATAVITAFGSTYTVQYAGLTSTGVRTAPTLSKA